MGWVQSVGQAVRRVFAGPAPVDPSRFGDPFALSVAWTPAAGGGTNFCTRKGHRTEATRFEFKATRGALLFYGIFLTLGLGLSVFYIPVWLSGRQPDAWFPALFGAIFAAVGGGLMRAGTRAIVFDRLENSFRHGDELVPLERVRALQLIAELVRGDKSSYWSYELNLVLGDGTRRNVVDHGSLATLREDARALAEFLAVPLWDAVE